MKAGSTEAAVCRRGAHGTLGPARSPVGEGRGKPLFQAFAWAGLEQVGRQCVRLVLSILLARLLAPEDYGLMGMLMVFLCLAQVFVDSGLSAALIQRKTISPDDETSVFYVNVAAGVLLTVALCLLSPFIAAFYGQPILIPLVSVSSLIVAVGSLGIVQTTLLTRAMDFRTQAQVTMISTLLSGLVGLGMAWQGCGVWSLVGQSLAQAVASVALVWRWSPWRPRGRFQWAAVKSLWPFSWRLLASAQLNSIFENLYSLVIGRIYRPADLGFYTRASTLAMLPAGSVTGMTQRVMFPVFSGIQDDKTRLKQEFRRTVLTLAALYFPLMAGFAVIADPLVLCLLTGKWRPCVPYLQVLCFNGMLFPLHALHLNLLMAQGRSDLFLRLEIVKKLLVILAVALTFRLGVGAMALSVLVHSVVALALNSYYTRRLIRYGWGQQLRDLLPISAVSLGMAGLVWILGRVMSSPAWVVLLAQVTLGALVYTGAALVLRHRGFQELWSVLGRWWLVVGGWWLARTSNQHG